MGCALPKKEIFRREEKLFDTLEKDLQQRYIPFFKRYTRRV
jgi:hypothetical protein